MVATISEQLQGALDRSNLFTGIVSDYQVCVQKIRELTVRNAQLDREAGELRLENDTLLRAVEEAQRSTASPIELEEAKSRAAELQAELVAAYKEKSSTAEERAQALQQLEVVREISGQQAIELEERSKERDRLLDEIKILREETTKLSSARELLKKELEDRTNELQKVQKSCEGLETENRDLVQRLIELKDSEVERMDATSKMCEDMVHDARRTAAEILANARANLAKEAASAAAMEESTRKLNAAAEAVGAAELPAKVARCAPGVHTGGCYALAMDAVGNALATCGADRVVRLWDVARGSITAELRGAHEAVNDVAFTLDSRMVLGAEDKSAVRIWDCRTGRLVNKALTGHAGKVTGIAANPMNADSVVTVSSDRSIKLWTLTNTTCTRTFRFPSTARKITVLADSGLVVSGHLDGKIRFWDGRSSRPDPVKEVPVHTGKEVCAVVSALSGGTVLTSGRDSTLAVVDTRSFAVRSRLSAPGYRVERTPMATPAFNPAASHVLAGSEDGNVYLWALGESAAGKAGQAASDQQQPKVVKILQQPKNAPKEQKEAAVVACAWSPTGLPVVTGDRLGGITFWIGAGEEKEGGK